MDCLRCLNYPCPAYSALNSPTLTKTFTYSLRPYAKSSTVRCEMDPHQRAAAHRQQLFNRIASNYDYLNDLLSLGQHGVWKRMAVSWSGAKDGDIALDICCGSGDLTFLLAEKVRHRGKVTGLDFADEQLIIASERQRDSWKSCYRNIEWIQGDALNLPFADSSFNAVTVGYGLRNVVDITQVLSSTVSILDFNRNSNSSSSLVQDWILDNVVVPVANRYGLGDEYAYLKTSIATFPTGKQQEKLALEVGFSRARHFEIGGGLMGVLVATH
ncbi:2-phytyl-1,4-beta-naphthoquinone methyltransferase, chloroplastic isoform X2 [Cryptomeria japonica]|uniref:2-phytyl-1,4-beta-naphthoquinone methyltransferase, chloroplastic isoform X2 n=1 Tax=Cryptomeria japonica TaxID=3369 RepID=UPI0027DA017E|nr:2-phytyl-1,4-beta-naphthoquinone methyltransferase, chloroplastic isoform X2 [Cryptomeria japonica]